MLLAVAFGLSSAAPAASAIKSVDVRETEDGYVVDLVCWVPAPRELAFEVLTDFEHMADWVPNVRASRVLKREGNRATIEYEAVVPFGFLEIPVTTVRETEFIPPAWIRTSQIRGNMKRHVSRLHFVSEAGGTRMDYHVDMAPGVIAALVLNKAIVERGIREHFDAITAEILRRKEATAPARP